LTAAAAALTAAAAAALTAAAAAALTATAEDKVKLNHFHLAGSGLCLATSICHAHINATSAAHITDVLCHFMHDAQLNQQNGLDQLILLLNVPGRF
jgi:hypothetical protein